MASTLSWIPVLLFPFALGCSGGDSGVDCAGSENCDSLQNLPQEVTPAPPGAPHKTLSEWGLFANMADKTPKAGLVRFVPISPLFTDYAVKERYFWLPEGTRIGYHPTRVWDFPVGAILVKSFGYPADERDASKGFRLIETRLLVRESEELWTAHTYLWNERQDEAHRKIAGKTVDTEWVDKTGERRRIAYSVPNLNICGDCHGVAEEMRPIGPSTRMLDTGVDYGRGVVNQIEHIRELGLFEGTPEPADSRMRLVDPFGDGSLSDRARSYLSSNCAHCHSDENQAAGSGLLLDWEHTDPTTGNPNDWGVCTMPSSAGGATCGLSVDVVPGDADQSIFMCRVDSEVPKVQMPPVGRVTAHVEGSALIREWINQMEPRDCGRTD